MLFEHHGPAMAVLETTLGSPDGRGILRVA